MRVAVAGSGRLVTSVLHALLESRHEVVAVVQNGRRTRGLRRKIAPRYLSFFGGESTAAGMAIRRDVPVIFIDRMADDLEPLKMILPDLLIVAGFDIILRRPLLDLPKVGCMNVHSSLLPRHRGPNPFCAVLLAGEEETGVTFHVMDEGIDTGDIVDQVALPVLPRDTALSLYARACEVAGARVVEVVDRVERAGLRGSPQDHDAATYEGKVGEEEARMDWRLSAEELDRRVRALSVTPAWFRHRGRRVHVLRAHYDATQVDAAVGTVLEADGPVRIATGAGTLIVEEAQSERWFGTEWPGLVNRPRRGECVA